MHELPHVDSLVVSFTESSLGNSQVMGACFQRAAATGAQLTWAERGIHRCSLPEKVVRAPYRGTGCVSVLSSAPELAWSPAPPSLVACKITFEILNQARLCIQVLSPQSVPQPPRAFQPKTIPVSAASSVERPSSPLSHALRHSGPVSRSPLKGLLMEAFLTLQPRLGPSYSCSQPCAEVIMLVLCNMSLVFSGLCSELLLLQHPAEDVMHR